MGSSGAVPKERVELYVSRWKMVALLGFMAPPSLGGLAAGILGGHAGGWMVGIPGVALCGLMGWTLSQSGKPYVVADRERITISNHAAVRKRGVRTIAWADVERAVLLAIIGRGPTRASRNLSTASHTLELHVRGEEDPVQIALSHLKGNSLELAERMEAVAGIPFEHFEQHGAFAEPEVVRKAD